MDVGKYCKRSQLNIWEKTCTNQIENSYINFKNVNSIASH